MQRADLVIQIGLLNQSILAGSRASDLGGSEAVRVVGHGGGIKSPVRRHRVHLQAYFDEE
jgi:hypothetical protein